MRERGTQARVGRPRPMPAPIDPRSPGRDRFWPTVAIVAIIAATIGWTTAVALALSRPTTTAVAAPSAEVLPTEEDLLEENLEPEVVSHEAADLEALIPEDWAGTPLTAQSLKGSTVLADDEWSVAMLAFIAEQGRTSDDLAVAQAFDESGESDLVIGVYRLDGTEASTLVEGMTSAWTAADSSFATSDEDIGGKSVTKGIFADDLLASYFYAGDGVVYDIETSDPELAAAVIASLP